MFATVSNVSIIPAFNAMTGHQEPISPGTSVTIEPLSAIGETGNFTSYDRDGFAHVAESRETARADGFIPAGEHTLNQTQRTDILL